MQRLATGCVFSALCSGLFGQTPPPAQQPATRPEFDAAVLKLNVSGGTQVRESTSAELRDGQVRRINSSMSQLFQTAFNVGQGVPVFAGAPTWFETDRWDLIAKAPPVTTDTSNTPADTAARLMRVRLMMQSFLTRELKLAIHTEQRPMSVYALTVGKDGPKLQGAADTGATPACSAVGSSGTSLHRACKNLGMWSLAASLQGWAPNYLADKQVLDKTGLTGAYDFNLDWAPLNQVDVDGVGGLTIFGAVEKLGLKLKMEKLPMPVIVIDHAEKPAQN
jgi:uncharacterized protein (TIGR03435 family)